MSLMNQIIHIACSTELALHKKYGLFISKVYSQVSYKILDLYLSNMVSKSSCKQS